MGSLLSTGTTRRNSPSWCKKGMWAGIPAIIAGLPASLVAYAKWYQKIYGVDINVTESMRLTLDPDTKDWTGCSSNEGTNLQINVCSLAETDHYDVELVLRYGTSITDSHTWHDVAIAPGPPFDSGPLRHVVLTDKWYYQLHARG